MLYALLTRDKPFATIPTYMRTSDSSPARGQTAKGMKRIDGVVEEALPATTFRVTLDDGRKILAYLSGNMRRFYIKILPGDRVIVEMTPYDETRGRIVRRL